MRDILNSRVVQLELNDHNQVLVSPAKNVAGALRKYAKKYTSLEDIRDTVWEKIAKDRVDGHAH